jgi:dolichol-phosphate mannosyltransferase
MLYFLVPVYNENENIVRLYNELTNALNTENKFYIFSDDGSTDGSIDRIKELFSKENFVVLSDGKNYGPGHAFNLGFEWVLQHSQDDNDVLITIEADGTSDFDILPRMLAVSRTGIDLVLASVYAQGGGFDQTTFIRKLLSFVANMILRFAFDIKVLTLSSFYRIYKLSILRKIKSKNKELISEYGFICMIEVLLKAIRANGSIVEIPMVLYSKKRVGKSKMKPFKTALSYIRFLYRNINSQTNI